MRKLIFLIPQAESSLLTKIYADTSIKQYIHEVFKEYCDITDLAEIDEQFDILVTEILWIVENYIHASEIDFVVKNDLLMIITPDSVGTKFFNKCLLSKGPAFLRAIWILSSITECD